MDLVSIVIPTYKGSNKIINAVESALNQDYPNIEIIVVDDNGVGTNEQILTESKLEKYIKNEKIIYIKHKENKNGSAARNTGISIAKGKYVALLDDDDIFHRHKIRKQISALKKHSDDKNYAVCYASYVNIFEDRRQREIYAEKEGNLCFELLSMKISVLSSVLLFRREAWEAVGGFDESLRRDQDQEFCTRLFNKYKVAVVKDICMTRYVLKRNVPNSVDIGVKYREYFLIKVKDIIEKFDKKQQKEIYSANYIAIAKRYLRRKKLLKTIKYILKSKTPFRGILKLVREYILYKKSFNNINKYYV